MVGIKKILVFPTECGDSLISRFTSAAGFRADDGVFAVGFVPDGYDVGTELGGLDEGIELGFCLMSEAIADAEGEFGAKFHGNDE
jgi:hypothetical protein